MAKNLQTSYEKLKRNFPLITDEPMKHHTSFKVGGPADLFARPESKDDLKRLIALAKIEHVDITVIGGGTNILVKDSGIRGLVISLANLTGEIEKNQRENGPIQLTAPAGNRLASICSFAMEKEFQGFEFAAGIPGLIGGALIMNAGTPEKTISDITAAMKTITYSGEEKIFKRPDLNFSYRKLENIDGIITEATFNVIKGDKEKIKKLREENLRKKKDRQPTSLPSAGCFFKNPEKGKSAGELIEAAGLKGKKYHDAAVSEKHANYIVNLGNARCTDILKLAETVKEKVLAEFSVELEREVVIKGE